MPRPPAPCGRKSTKNWSQCLRGKKNIFPTLLLPLIWSRVLSERQGHSRMTLREGSLVPPFSFFRGSFDRWQRMLLDNSILNVLMPVSQITSEPATLYTLCHAMLCCAKSLHVLTLCDPMDCSLPGSSVHEILQARILE